MDDLHGVLSGIANVYGSAFSDRLYGSAGDNLIRPGAGSDYVYGLGGNDTVDYSNAAGAVYVHLSGGYAYEGPSGSNWVAFTGTAGSTTDYLVGISNADGSAFSDRIYGTAGDNLLRPGGGSDYVYGLGGSDTVDYSDHAQGVRVELFNHYAFEYGAGGLAGGVIVASDYLVGIANAIGTSDNDRLYGDSGNNVLRPGAGADWLYGMGGSDTVDYSDVAAGVYVDIEASFAVKATTDGASFLDQAMVGLTTTDSVSGFTHATGSTFDDRLYGTGGSNMEPISSMASAGPISCSAARATTGSSVATASTR